MELSEVSLRGSYGLPTRGNQLNSPQYTPYSELYHHSKLANRYPDWVLPIYGADVLDGHMLLYMKPAEKGSLQGLVGCLDESALKYVVRWLLTVHELLRRQGLMHADIKPGNILVDGQGRLFMADFGMVQTLVDGRASMHCGTFVAPEVKERDYCARADLFSIGKTIQELQIPGGKYSVALGALVERWASDFPEERPDIFDPAVRTWLGLGAVATTPLLPNGRMPVPSASFIESVAWLPGLGEEWR